MEAGDETVSVRQASGSERPLIESLLDRHRIQKSMSFSVMYARTFRCTGMRRRRGLFREPDTFFAGRGARNAPSGQQFPAAGTLVLR
jgi:hypothetical protein